MKYSDLICEWVTLWSLWPQTQQPKHALENRWKVNSALGWWCWGTGSCPCPERLPWPLQIPCQVVFPCSSSRKTVCKPFWKCFQFKPLTFVPYNCFSKGEREVFDEGNLICIRSCVLRGVQGVLLKEIEPGPAFLEGEDLWCNWWTLRCARVVIPVVQTTSPFESWCALWFLCRKA